MSILAFLLTIVSLMGLSYLTLTDPKRRRTFRQEPLNTRILLWPARLSVLVPPIWLMTVSDWSGLAIWAGAVTVLGWVLAALPPQSIQSYFARAFRGLAASTATVRPVIAAALSQVAFQLSRLDQFIPKRRVTKGVTQSDTSALEARIVTLEARLHRVENELALYKNTFSMSGATPEETAKTMSPKTA
ncbi:MAG: hypothetical protein AAGH74_01325 [Pseudomonadota bacterium]